MPELDYQVDRAVNDSAADSGISPASPPESRNITSFFEFWPTWLMYFPVALQWLLLSLRYRSLTLPLIANPGIHLSGMVGGSKAEVMGRAQGACAEAILPWILFRRTEQAPAIDAEQVLQRAQTQGISLPFVCKPDMGCRGAGVKLIHSEQELQQTLECYPQDAGVIIQQLAQSSPEAGIFFVRHPDQSRGHIASLTFKETPAVTGDGVSTLAELVQRDRRAGQLLHLYQQRNQQDWDRVLADGERKSLLFSASHCRGAVFHDGRQFISEDLTSAINRIMADLPDFHYGRLDVKYADLDSLIKGETLEIVEINGASSEAIHIWDRRTRLLDAITTLLWQYRTLFQIGNKIRRRGGKPPPFSALIRAWRREKSITQYYPETD